MNKKWLEGLRIGSMAIALGLGLSSSSVWGQAEETKESKTEQTQRIRIVDRDGRELSPNIVIKRSGPDQDQDSIEVTHNNGVFTIRDADGNEREINAVSVMVSASQKTTVENGEEKTEIVKKAIVTDADGKTYVVDLSSGDQAEGAENALPPMVLRKTSAGKFMIGVAAQPVSEALAEQLNLDPNTGLVVQQISPTSPAEKAGLQVDDVLLFADQKPLATVEDLVAVVQASGEKKEPISLTLVRDDKEMSVEITPEERNLDLVLGGPGAMAFQFKVDPEFQEALENMGDFNFDWAEAGPGIVIQPGDLNPEAIRAQIEMMQEQHRAHLDQMRKAFADRDKAVEAQKKPRQEAASADQMREMRDEIKRLREEIESLKKDKK